MGYEEFVKFHANKVDMVQEQLFNVQMDLIKAYERQWAEMNYLIENGYWDKKAFYLANAYGLKIDDEMYVFQLNASLPFLPNPYYTRFKKSREEFMAAKMLVWGQLRDVINQLEVKQLRQPAALLIKHYHDGTRIFDMDNRAKQVVINSLRPDIIADDNVQSLPFYSEEAIQAEENRTMLYLGPYSKRVYIEDEIVKLYPKINNLLVVVEGKYPGTFFPECPSGMDNTPIHDSSKHDLEDVKKDSKWTVDNPFM